MLELPYAARVHDPPLSWFIAQGFEGCVDSARREAYI